MSILVGCDPEIFVKDQSGAFISGHNLVPGTKADPFQLLSKKGAIQVDGTALEFNIAPASSLDEFLNNIKVTLRALKFHADDGAKKYDIGPISLAIEPTATFDKAYFDTIPESAKELGCTPDFNAWTERQNEPPHTDLPFRTASGHLHIGWTEAKDHMLDVSHLHDCMAVVKLLDQTVYPVSLLWDDDQSRRGLYGKVGAFRPKPYGVEYRVLSNKWVADERLQRWVYLAVRQAMSMLEHPEKHSLDEVYCKYFLSIENPSKTIVLSYYEMLVSKGFPQLPKEFLNVR